MDTYPPEFVIHLQPTLIVTGLLPAEDASSNADALSSQEKRNVNPTLEAQKAALLHAMLSRNNVSYWDNTKGLAGSLYFVVPEQRSYILQPTRKFLQQTGQQYQVPSLSPSSPSSPLYPDGLISPVWLRRHREQIPSVFIAIVDLWDRESVISNASDHGNRTVFSDKGPLGVVDPMEREHDIVLAQELLERRKVAQERTVKFAAVIILQRSHMEDPSIEDRLNFVRKSAGLDIKNSFYVLSPSSPQEISEFAINLQRSQYEGSMNYYKEQIKRHKKKKSNLPSTSASVRPQQGNGGSQQFQQDQLQQQQGLSVQGWMLRYDYKMGMFSECKQDIDNAVKYYESAYGLLVDMFAVTSSITPGASGLQARTKRWAEAKVLADCLCLKICKFHLYLDAPSTAFFHFRRHLIVFKALSTSWRMGDDSFEYWAWLGKQYRVLGDLIDIGTKSGFKLPSPSPGSVVYGSFAGMTDGAKDLSRFSGVAIGGSSTGFGIGPNGDAYPYNGNVGGGRGGGTHGPGAGINPMLVLQHAGYFYHQAANCSVQRRLRFEIAEEAYPDSNVAPVPSANIPHPPSLQSMNAERTIDHLSLTVELLTKSYEQFKRHKAGRMTMFLASEIAGTYYTAGKFEMALKFFERIGKTYRKEGWNLILTSILKWSVQCAKELGFWETVVECYIEMLSPEMPSTPAKRQSIFDELVSILHTEISPANKVSHNPVVVSMPQINSFVTCAVQFQGRQSFVSSPSKFQLQLFTQGGEDALPQPFRVSFIDIEFTDPSLNHRLQDSRPYGKQNDSSNPFRFKDRTGRRLSLHDCTHSTSQEIVGQDPEQRSRRIWVCDADLDIHPHEVAAYEGVVIPQTEQIVKITKISMGIVTEHWNVTLVFPSPETIQEADPAGYHLPAVTEAPKRQWMEKTDAADSPSGSLRLRNLDRGVRTPPSLSVVPRESKVEIESIFKSPAYLDEYFPIKIKVRNGEKFAVSMEMDVELLPIDPSIESSDFIFLDPADQTDANQALLGLRPSKKGADSDPMVPVGEWAEQVIYVKACEIPTPRTVVCKVRYEVVTSETDQTRSWTEKHHSFRVLFIPPFDAEVDYFHQPASKMTADAGESTAIAPILERNTVDEKHGTVLIPALTHREQYLMSTKVNNEGPWPVQVKEVKLILGSAMDALLSESASNTKSRQDGAAAPLGLSRNHSISRARDRKKSLHDAGIYVDLVEDSVQKDNAGVASESSEGKLGGSIKKWAPNNLVSFNHLIQVTAADLELAPEQVDIGFLQIQWRRYQEDPRKQTPYTMALVPLQPLTLPKAEIFMTVDLPKDAKVNRPFTARYKIENPTGRVHELSMTVEPSEGMVYAGVMQSTLRILPYGSLPIQMNCYPLQAGLVRLPRVKLVINKRKPIGRAAAAAAARREAPSEEVLVKVRGATRLANGSMPAGASSEAVVIFVKPETGDIA
ncbi:trafficking protein particle complex subunit 11 [Entomortierella parvispora]|uniref:Trafficking protein particle complex subunit 11 n=1 Tax=Entomortierella parvispora TaxID=205924 RepID=A0A9P3HKB3_9FUNG|nr:trafficking protein particle complex subunit 11 [Entomortierella parvispora]